MFTLLVFSNNTTLRVNSSLKVLNKPENNMASYLFVYTKPSDYFIGQDCEIGGSGWRRKFLFLETMTFKLGYISMSLPSVVKFCMML